MISALAIAARVFDNGTYLSMANAAADFILKRLRHPNGRLIHRYRDGQAALPDHIDDYAFFIWGLLELYGSSFEVERLQKAIELNNIMVKYFWDEKDGGFFCTPSDGESLLVRPKDIYDGAIPSGNSIAMLNLLTLGRITAEAEYERKAARMKKAFAANVIQTPMGYTQFLNAVGFDFGPTYELVIVGDKNSQDTREMLRILHSEFLPYKVVLFRPAKEKNPAISEYAEFTRNQSALDNKSTAYVCFNYSCELPTNDPQKMLRSLKQQ
jgi:uncharacterized protein YyaL (SSP411 family)